MTEPTEHRDDHVLVVTERADGGFIYAVECPLIGDTPQRRARCAYLDDCGCQERYLEDRATVAKLLGEEDDYEALSPMDWVDGTRVALRPNGTPAGAQAAVADLRARTLIRIDVPEHEECPVDGLKHHIWEGEVMTPTGECAVTESVNIYGFDVVESLDITAPGRYLIEFESLGEDGIDLRLLDETPVTS